MKTKLIYIATAAVAILILAFASAGATGRQVGRQASSRQARPTISIQYISLPNGDYKLYLFASDRELVCEEKTIQVVEQGDAVSPVVLECRH